MTLIRARGTYLSVALLAALATLLVPSPARAQSACKTLYDTMEELATIPHHSYSSETTLDGKELRTFENITIDGVIYDGHGDTWTKSRITPQEMRDQQQEDRKRIKNVSCKYERDDFVRGEPAQMYVIHPEKPAADIDTRTMDSRIWLSKRTGLILRAETDYEALSVVHRKFRISTRYEYSNVTTPAVSK